MPKHLPHVSVSEYCLPALRVVTELSASAGTFGIIHSESKDTYDLDQLKL